MGHANTHEQLALRWAELCADPMLKDLPGKFELNAYGVIEMSPGDNRHVRMEMSIGMALQQQLPGGTSLVECCIATTDGIRVPEVWIVDQETGGREVFDANGSCTDSRYAVTLPAP